MGCPVGRPWVAHGLPIGCPWDVHGLPVGSPRAAYMKLSCNVNHAKVNVDLRSSPTTTNSRCSYSGSRSCFFLAGKWRQRMTIAAYIKSTGMCRVRYISDQPHHEQALLDFSSELDDKTFCPDYTGVLYTKTCIYRTRAQHYTPPTTAMPSHD